MADPHLVCGVDEAASPDRREGLRKRPAKLADKPSQSPLICGVDEAGRGPVLGPLVVAGVAVTDEGPLRKLGVRDSKQLSPARRRKLAPRIREVAAGFELVSLQAEDLDTLRATMTLNRIEARLFGKVVAALQPEVAYLDAADANAATFARMVRGGLAGARGGVAGGSTAGVRLVSEHKADTRYPVVAAASILAKVERDRAMAELEAELGEPIGSGYPSDPATLKFIKRYWLAKGELPPQTRRTWKTVSHLIKPQASLDRYGL